MERIDRLTKEAKKKGKIKDGSREDKIFIAFIDNPAATGSDKWKADARTYSQEDIISYHNTLEEAHAAIDALIEERNTDSDPAIQIFINDLEVD